MPESSPEFLTVDEVAGRLRVSRSSAYGLVRRGELASHEFAGSIRIRVADLDQFIAGCRKECGDAPGKPARKSKRIAEPYRPKMLKL